MLLSRNESPSPGLAALKIGGQSESIVSKVRSLLWSTYCQIAQPFERLAVDCQLFDRCPKRRPLVHGSPALLHLRCRVVDLYEDIALMLAKRKRFSSCIFERLLTDVLAKSVADLCEDHETSVIRPIRIFIAPSMYRDDVLDNLLLDFERQVVPGAWLFSLSLPLSTSFRGHDEKTVTTTIIIDEQ